MPAKIRIAHHPRYNVKNISTNLETIRLKFIKDSKKSSEPKKVVKTCHASKPKPSIEYSEISQIKPFIKPIELEKPQFPEEIDTLIRGLRAISEIYTHLPIKKRKIRPFNYGFNLSKKSGKEQ